MLETLCFSNLTAHFFIVLSYVFTSLAMALRYAKFLLPLQTAFGTPNMPLFHTQNRAFHTSGLIKRKKFTLKTVNLQTKSKRSGQQGINHIEYK